MNNKTIYNKLLIFNRDDYPSTCNILVLPKRQLELLEKISNLSEDLQKDLIKKNGFYIRFISNPSDSMLDYVAQYFPYDYYLLQRYDFKTFKISIEYLCNPKNEMFPILNKTIVEFLKKYNIKNNEIIDILSEKWCPSSRMLFKFNKKLTLPEKLQLKILRDSCANIRFINNLSEKAAILAIKIDPSISYLILKKSKYSSRFWDEILEKNTNNVFAELSVPEISCIPESICIKYLPKLSVSHHRNLCSILIRKGSKTSSALLSYLYDKNTDQLSRDQIIKHPNYKSPAALVLEALQ